jgi:hypothetical protein
LNASKGQCFLQFLHSSRPGSTRFGASVGCWKRCFQGYEYKNVIENSRSAVSKFLKRQDFKMVADAVDLENSNLSWHYQQK